MAGAFHEKQLNHSEATTDKAKRPNISKSYIIGIDISDNHGASVLIISHFDGAKMTVVNTFTGEDAERIYEELTNQEARKRTNTASSGLIVEYWCENQSADVDGVVRCLAHLSEGRVLTCPYPRNEDRLRSKYPCSDYQPDSKKELGYT